MKKELTRRHIDIAAFARAGQRIEGADRLRDHERLAQELPADLPAPTLDLPVTWQAQGEWRADTAGGAGQPWLHLQAEATLPLQCQRCLLPVEVTARAERSFRFVADEATAEALDDESEEDVLALTPAFDLAGLVEDELLMALPLVPRHTVCPTDVVMEVEDPAFAAAQAEKPHPFAALKKLRPGPDR